ncbi:hypothetical protein [Faecalicatena contorta]|uniref:hypothetical protein n=1 Tax=Faecalicatena contorta TaxID=39482 RepID=UPI001F191187|nr:hypothetical protein [Faecalicatena contorta]MCF2554389.1 hypothetical protein [Faecalicatena contorta]
MWLEKMYDTYYASGKGEGETTDEIDKQVVLLLEGMKTEGLKEEELFMLLCQAVLIGEKKGFLTGASMIFELFLELMIRR